MKQKDIKFEKVMEEFTKLEEQAMSKVRELLEKGILTTDMLEFDFYNGDTEVDADFVIKFKDASIEKITRHFVVEFQLQIREA